MRIAIGGMGTESCTFSPLPTKLEDFTVRRGQGMLRKDEFPFLSRWGGDIELVPTLNARALPGGSVEPAAYDSLKGELLDRLREALPLQGVYLSLHGAMHVRGRDDAEGDLLSAVRGVVGPEAMISCSFDLHGNVSKPLVDAIDMMTAYRTAPHVDRIATREKACSMLVRCLHEGRRPMRHWIPVPVILSGERTSTEAEPAGSIYAGLSELDSWPEILDVSLLMGYTWADEPRSTSTVIATGFDEEVIGKAACRVARRHWDAREKYRFGVPAGTMDEMIGLALEIPDKAVFISDSGDNPTAGGAGDVPALLERLLACKVPDAVYAGLPDAAAVAVCRVGGVGAEVDLKLGGKLDPINGVPLAVSGRVLNVVPGDPTAGDQAVVQVDGVQVILTERRKPFHYISDFQFLGIEPLAHKIVVVKIGYLVPDLKRAASKALLALSPGAVDQATERPPYKRIGRPIFPLDRDFQWGCT